MLDVGEVKLHVVEEGRGEPVLLLHGFPESWWSWRHQMTALSAAGFRAIAPNQRGYELSDKPRGVSSYRAEKLAGDVAGVVAKLGLGRVHLVGHDWGGAVAWYVAAWHPEIVRKLVILNAPHPSVFLRTLARSPKQLRMSWYMFLFQLPGVAERFVLADGFLERAMRTVRDGAIGPDDLARFRDALRQPGAATGALSWYRAAFRPPWPKLPRIAAPTMVIWGEQDAALSTELLDGLDEEVDQLRIERLPDASHWVQQDRPGEVDERLIAFLRS